MADNKTDKSKVDLGLLEEDDEFEEFPAEDWTAKDEDNEDISVWEDNWDDDDVEDDFNQQLRAQLEKQKAQGDPSSKDN
ncbi:26S proteasome complex subunit SEM1 [Orussus abietinus]|uniref:26S proteasome complex subunit SEM1 n=1 Tax=Orussus abietinus TaxID=222816 RepID=UPI000626727D|nr:26S proteasome complex subunit SEM1 [Orussus abietinus]